MTWEESTVMSQREKFCFAVTQPGANISALCRTAGISRQTGYKWLREYKQSGVAGLDDRSRRPHHSPNQSSPVIIEQIRILREKHPQWGARKIRALLGKMNHQESLDNLPAASTVHSILHNLDLVNPPEPPVEHPTVTRFVYPHPNDLWQMDLKAPIRLPSGQKVYPVAIIDDHSRYLLGLWMTPDATAKRILRCWIASATVNGLPIGTLTDHGGQFRTLDDETSMFRVHLWACGVEHHQGRPRHPQTQGKIERFNRTLKEELLTSHHYATIADWQTCFDDWREVYNTIRPHQELDYQTPSECYHLSDRAYVEPDRRARFGHLDSFYRRVDCQGKLSLGCHRILAGRGFAGWTVEIRILGYKNFAIFFREHFVKMIELPSQTT